jgi:hypothetical protein
MFSVALSPNARALIRASREARRPTAADRERVAEALRARLGATVLPLDTPPGKPLMMSGSRRRLAAICGLCVACSVLLLARRPETASQSTLQIRDTAKEEAPAASAFAKAPTPTPSAAAAAVETSFTTREKITPIASQHTRLKTALAAPAEDTLSQELVLLTCATSQLSSGQATAALVVLDEHQRRFPHGILSDERNAAKGRALCSLHRFDEGHAALALLATGTPFAARVREECDSALSPSSTAASSRKAASE